MQNMAEPQKCMHLLRLEDKIYPNKNTAGTYLISKIGYNIKTSEKGEKKV